MEQFLLACLTGVTVIACSLISYFGDRLIKSIDKLREAVQGLSERVSKLEQWREDHRADHKSEDRDRRPCE